MPLQGGYVSRLTFNRALPYPGANALSGHINTNNTRTTSIVKFKNNSGNQLTAIIFITKHAI